MIDTGIVKSWITTGKFTKIELSGLLGISRPTLDLRLKKDNWRYKEVLEIIKLTKK